MKKVISVLVLVLLLTSAFPMVALAGSGSFTATGTFWIGIETREFLMDGTSITHEYDVGWWNNGAYTSYDPDCFQADSTLTFQPKKKGSLGTFNDVGTLKESGRMGGYGVSGSFTWSGLAAGTYKIYERKTQANSAFYVRDEMTVSYN